MRPTDTLAAPAKACACVVAFAIRPDKEHVCDCANCCETAVPAILNDSVSPLFNLAMLCCKVVRLATVVFVFAKGPVRLNAHCSAGVEHGLVAHCVLTPDKFAAVIPDPCSAASTSSNPVLMLDCTVTAKIA
jgi:hypothetical protein